MQLKCEVPLKPYKIPTNLDQLIQTLKLNYSYDHRYVLLCDTKSLCGQLHDGKTLKGMFNVLIGSGGRCWKVR